MRSSDKSQTLSRAPKTKDYCKLAHKTSDIQAFVCEKNLNSRRTRTLFETTKDKIKRTLMIFCGILIATYDTLSNVFWLQLQ